MAGSEDLETWALPLVNFKTSPLHYVFSRYVSTNDALANIAREVKIKMIYC